MSKPVADDTAANMAKDLQISEAFAAALLDPNTQNQFRLDVAEYTKTTIMIEDKFRTVFNKLEAFDNEGLADQGSTPLHETWRGFQTSFKGHLNASREVAGEIAASCHDYLSTIVKPTANLPLTATTREMEEQAVQNLLDEIERFFKDAKEIETKAAVTRDGFSALAAEIKTFRDNFEKYGKGHQSDNLVKIGQLDNEIGTLKGEITELEGHIRRLGWGMVGVGVGTAVLATAAAAFCPVAALAILAVGAIAVTGQAIAIGVLQGKINDKNSAIKDKDAEKLRIKAENDRIDAIRTELRQMGQNEIENILGGLEFFRMLWAQITADVHTIQGYLQKIQDRTIKVKDPKKCPESVFVFLKTGTTLSYGLTRGLKLYQIGVESEEASKIEYKIPIN